MLTGEQVRAAIAGLRWSQAVLAERSGVPPRTVQRVADADGLPATQAPTLAALRKAFEEGGAVFVEQDGVSGVMVPPSPRPEKPPRTRRAKAAAQ